MCGLYYSLAERSEPACSGCIGSRSLRWSSSATRAGGLAGPEESPALFFPMSNLAGDFLLGNVLFYPLELNLAVASESCEQIEIRLFVAGFDLL